jgi:uncharacterized protein DUF5694
MLKLSTFAGMKLSVFSFVFFVLVSSVAHAQMTVSKLMIVGSDHLDNVYKKDKPTTDVLTAKNQGDIQKFIAFADSYKPDMILVEVLPEKQPQIDSLYNLYLLDKLKFDQLPDGRSEVYQLAFRIGKRMGIERIVCVNAPGGTSQSILANGNNIELYQSAGIKLRELVTGIYSRLGEGKISFFDFLNFLNQTETINKVYQLRYIIPSRVTDGKFVNPDAMVDTAFINPKYIGAELTSLYKNRDYKIYSNIVNARMKSHPERMLLIIGVAHIGSLKSIFRDDPYFKLADFRR